VLAKPGIHLISELPKDTLLIGERMPLFSRVVKVNQNGELEPIVIDSSVGWKVTTVEGSVTVAEGKHWRDVWHESLPEDPGHTEWWYTGTLAGLSEGKVKVQARVGYFTSGDDPQIEFLTGPEHEVEVRGFVDLWSQRVGEWDEEDPGIFMAKGSAEWQVLRTCTGGDVVLSWSSDRIGYYTDSLCTMPVEEDACSVEGSRQVTFTPLPDPALEHPLSLDRWGAQFRVTDVYCKGLETSSTVRDTHVSLVPVSGEASPDLVNVTVVKLDLAATDLDGAVAENKEEDPGAFVHENRDSDNVSTPLMPFSTRRVTREQ